MIKRTIVLILCLSSALLADRKLSSTETALILKILTSTPRLMWLPAGTIQARHLEYYDSEKNAIESTETMHINDTQFYWEIMLSDAASDTPGANIPQQALTGDVDSRMNQHRIFSWDGTTLIRYYKSAGHAVVETEMPGKIGGPFSAGIIPWGHGFYTLENLSKCTTSAWKKTIDGQTLIELKIIPANASAGMQMSYLLDPARYYAVINYEMEDPTFSKIRQTYRNYVKVSQKWVPTIITIERFNKQPYGLQLKSYEDWKFDLISPEIPGRQSLNIEFDKGTLVEIQPSHASHSIQYHAADKTKINELLSEKITLQTESSTKKSNCAGIAATFVAKKFSHSVSAEQLATMTSSDNQMTSLYQLKQTLEEAGLSCMAVETDLETLKQSNHCQIVLHLPASNHYIILDDIDDQYVWAIDLTNRKFYYRTPIDEFKKQWSTGTALLISDHPQHLPMQQGKPISLSIQQQIRGGDPAGYSCTDLLQVEQRILCTQPDESWMCSGAYYRIWERTGCKEDPNGGFCSGSNMLGYDYTHCINDTANPTECTTTGQWYSRFIRACQ
ncbi:MAG: cysteine peptidase family C39 domain-containing protein [Anaerohalosphaeraceae bacterium]